MRRAWLLLALWAGLFGCAVPPVDYTPLVGEQVMLPVREQSPLELRRYPPKVRLAGAPLVLIVAEVGVAPRVYAHRDGLVGRLGAAGYPVVLALPWHPGRTDLDGAVASLSGWLGRRPYLCIGHGAGGLLGLRLQGANRRVLLGTPWQVPADTLLSEALLRAAGAAPDTVDPALLQGRPVPDDPLGRSLLETALWQDAGVTGALDWLRTEGLVPFSGPAVAGLVRQLQTPSGPPFAPTVPTLVVAAKLDRVVPPESAVPAMAALGEAATWLSLSIANGFEADPGHLSMVLGPIARDAVIPRLLEWLRSRPAAPPTGGA